MSDEPDDKEWYPKWSRWHPITKTTPSGKTMFVCLVCGKQAVAPSKYCSDSVAIPPNLGGRLLNLGEETDFRAPCEVIEERVNAQRLFRATKQKRLDAAELLLKSPPACRCCMGWGCNVCGGKGAAH